MFMYIFIAAFISFAIIFMHIYNIYHTNYIYSMKYSLFIQTFWHSPQLTMNNIHGILHP